MAIHQEAGAATGARSRHVVWWDLWSGSAREMRMYRVTEFWCSINKTPFMAKICLRAPVRPVVVAGVTEVGTDPHYT